MADAKGLMSAAAKATLRGDPDAVDKAEVALAALEDGRRKKTIRPPAAPASDSDVQPMEASAC